MSHLPESNSNPNQNLIPETQQVHSGGGDNVSRDKNVTSYFSEIGGDFKGIQGDISGGNITQYIITQKSGIEIRSQRLITGSPYLGLRKFETDDKDKFFGRDQWIVELTNYLEKENVLLLLGASGSGKSSLIQAGLIPALKDRWGSNQLINLTFVPDVNPFESFYGCLLTKYKQSEAKLAQTVQENTLIQVVQSLKKDSHWLIFIDQFEELFTRTPKTERDIFIKSLIELIERSDSSVKIILTMRADFLDKLSPYSDLGKIHDRYSRMLTDMEDSELRLAIAEPAARNLEGKEPVSRRADKSSFGEGNLQETVLNKLIDNRLLVSKGEDGKATVEVAHETLLRSWKVLQDLIREKEEIIVLRTRLDADSKQWDELRQKDPQKANSELWGGSKLARIVELRKEQSLPNLDAVAIGSINASVEERDRIQKPR